MTSSSNARIFGEILGLGFGRLKCMESVMFRKCFIAVASMTLAGQLQAASVPNTAILEEGSGTVSLFDNGGGSYSLFDNFDWVIGGNPDETGAVAMEVQADAAGQFSILDAFISPGLFQSPPARGLFDEFTLNDFMVSGSVMTAVLETEIQNERGVLSAGSILVMKSADFAFADGGLQEMFDFLVGNAANTLDYDVDFAVHAALQPIPLPAGAVLLLTGMGGMVLLRRRKAD